MTASHWRQKQIFFQIFRCTGDTCTVCGHPTMNNYKIVAVLAFWLSLLLLLLLLKQLQIGSTRVLFVATPLLHIASTCVLFVAAYFIIWVLMEERGESLDDCLSLEAQIFLEHQRHIMYFVEVGWPQTVHVYSLCVVVGWPQTVHVYSQFVVA